MPKVLEGIPREFWDDREWAYAHYQDLAKKYPDKWVAIMDKEIVAVSDGSGNILEEARARTKREYIPIVFLARPLAATKPILDCRLR
ncbi:MAG: DUF5678 domain-containing protein, partial [bacterium]|nr:DUF5678 domain-containing protein [bacterium]